MEVRINNHGKDALSTKTFFSDESGFAVASVIILGNNDAALVDAQWTLANGHRVAAEILEAGKNLKYIYVTHAHPDHYFGLGPITEAFPEAKVIALPSVARVINKQMFGKINEWKNIIGPTNESRKVVRQFLTDHDYHFILGDGGYYAFVNVGPWMDAAHMADSFALIEHLAAEHGVAVVPGGAFSEEGDRWIRFSYALPPEITARALERFHAGLKTLE